MSKLLPALLGWNAQTVRSPRLPRPLFAALLVTTIAFYLSNAFNSPISRMLIQGKWIPLMILLVVGLTLMRNRRLPAIPAAIMIPLGTLFAVAAAGIFVSVDRSFSLLSLITVTGSIVCAYAVSAVVIATDSRRAYFELLAAIGRVVVVISFLFVLAGLNLGRGGGSMSAWTDNPNTLAVILCPPMIVFLAGCIEQRPGWLVKHGAFFFLAFLLVWATGARAAIVWLGLSMTAFWMYRRGPGLVTVGVILALIIVIGWWFPIKEFVIEGLGLRWQSQQGGISPLSGREEVWRIGWQLFWDRPMTGYGLGSSQEIIKAESWRFVKHQGLHFHSSYLMVAAELGIIGFFAFVVTLLMALVRAISDSGRKAVLPRESWPLGALPFALVAGALGHGLFESWLLASGNVNMMMFWTWVWMIYHQAQVTVRSVSARGPGQTAPRTALPAR